ncbi:hypothetical protein PHISCL_01912 [Aspergillus sclerotialis]|uniref:Aminoglycoside phosphotransferase domain-containing protein n=1 Tax=Aspergillus sclerotialis TaxID=2070753 RepID=A0A3A3A214_9EURO|nr:hypothetical protein PHISCL_01912 [Aspergillus sclerotialis]
MGSLKNSLKRIIRPNEYQNSSNAKYTPTALPFPDGVKVLHDCLNATVDICSVHVLTLAKDTPPREAQQSSHTYIWLRCYIVQKSVARSNRLIDHATNLLNDLTTDRAVHNASSRALIFVAHSLGGLICKKAILLSRNNPEAHLRNIFDCTKGIIFMGTPHKGTWMADWTKIPVGALGLVKSTNMTLRKILETDDQYTLLKRVRLDELTAKASELRVWLARIRRFNATSPPPALRDYIFRSEVATLKFLEGTAFPAPKVFDYALEGEQNPVGVGYMLTEKLPGSSLRWSMPLIPEKKVMEQLADIFIELRKHPFEKMGSLDSPGSSHLGVFAQESLTDFGKDSRMSSLGPYTSPQDYHTASIQLTLDIILRDELYSHRPIDGYLIHRFLLDLVPSVLPSDESNLFFLKHADDKGDHILVGEEFNVTGIFDWEWAYTAPGALAFNSPIMLLPVAQFYDGANNIGEQEEVFAQIFEAKGHPNLASIVRKGRIQHRFAFCCRYDLWNDWDGFQGLFQGLRDAVNDGAHMNWDQWKAHAMNR